MTKILIIGTGAIGGLYGAKLAQAGAEVSVLCRSDYETVKKNGISIHSHWGNFHFTPKKVLRDLRDYQDQADFILVSTKVLPEISVPDLVTPVLAPNSSIVLLQNGLNIEKPVAAAFTDYHLISAIAFVCVQKNKAGIVDHQDYGRLIIGDFGGGVSEKTAHLIDLWRKAGVPCEPSENIQMERWKKLVWNASFNPISVLSGGADTGKILNILAAKNLVQNVMQEICTLAEADGCKLPEDVIAKNIEATEKMKPYKTSMLLDFEAGRKMEVEAILGNAIAFARDRAISVPHLSSLYGLLACY